MPPPPVADPPSTLPVEPEYLSENTRQNRPRLTTTRDARRCTIPRQGRCHDREREDKSKDNSCVVHRRRCGSAWVTMLPRCVLGGNVVGGNRNFKVNSGFYSTPSVYVDLRKTSKNQSKYFVGRRTLGIAEQIPPSSGVNFLAPATAGKERN